MDRTNQMDRSFESYVVKWVQPLHPSCVGSTWVGCAPRQRLSSPPTERSPTKSDRADAAPPGLKLKSPLDEQVLGQDPDERLLL